VRAVTADVCSESPRRLVRESLQASECIAKKGKAMSAANVATPAMTAREAEIADKGLKANAIGFVSNLVVGTASVAPAYSLAATLGFVAAINGIGVFSPGVMIAAFVPMLLIASAYRYLNRADPDCGTTFAWVTRALGPQLGWINGWTIFIADVIVMASLAEVAATYTYQLFGWDYGSSHIWIVIAGAVAWIVLMTWICHRGVELSARLQQFLLGYEVTMLVIFSVVALATVYLHHPTGSIHPEVKWLNPFGGGFSPMVDGVLLAVFIYWGWDSGVALNEETRDKRNGPGLAAILSTLLLVMIYVLVSASAQAYHGTSFLIKNSSDVLTPLGPSVLGSVGNKLLIIAILCSASASTQTTILPTARTTLSMARWGAIPEAFGRVHPRFKTPSLSTIGMGAISIVWTVLLLALNPSLNVLGDAIAGLGFCIAFYYGFTGIACVVYFRKRIFSSVHDFVFVGLAPLAGALILFGIFGKAFHDYSKAANNYSKPILGIQTSVFIGIGGILLGLVFMALAYPWHRDYFRRRPEQPDADGYAIGTTIAPEDEPVVAVTPASA
jgi:amino acid transporter